jgi:hypothetical protein
MLAVTVIDPGRRRRGRRGPQTPYHARPLGVILLPRRLEDFELHSQAADLMRAPGIVAVEPARVSYEAYLRMPTGVGDGIAAIQARRLPLAGAPRLVIIFSPLQYPLARALIALHPGCELWYVPAAAPPGGSRRRRERIEELHIAADARAALSFDVDALMAGERFPASGWARVESLGIESGRLGSERPGIMDS